MKNFLTVLLVLLFIIILLAIPLWLIKSKREEKTMPSLSEPIRKPAVAGSFYPSDSEELETTLSALINQSEKISAKGILRILIVPHAGIQFSGPTAAAGFKQVEGKGYNKIIILGASHRAFFDHTAVFEKGAWETPLGKTLTDETLAANLIDKNKKIIADETPHRDEHSLEIELIFLQKVLKDFKIIPILVSQTSDQLISDLARKITQNFDEQTLLVVSTDLSHYPSWEIANKVDRQTTQAILSGQKSEFEKTITESESANYSGLDTAACGAGAVRVALKVAEILQIRDFKEIKYENSGDISGDKSRVVGYAAIGAWSEKLLSAENQLDKSAQKEALEITRKTLEEHLSGRPIPIISAQNQTLQQPLGAFVTLRKHDELRGCIGEFEPQKPLYQVIQEMAIAAATKDIRFPPVTADELKNIKIEISVMTPKKKTGNWQEIQLEKHGVVIQKGLRSGTFLPQVATETGWSLEEFLSQLCSQKAGLPANCYKDPSVNLFIFEAQVFEE